MISIDGTPLDLTNPDTWGDKVTILEGGSITTLKDGVTTVITNAEQDKEKDSKCSSP